MDSPLNLTHENLFTIKLCIETELKKFNCYLFDSSAVYGYLSEVINAFVKIKELLK